MADVSTGPDAHVIEGLQRDVSELRREIGVLRRTLEDTRKHFFEPSVIISVVALLFSFGTTIVSYWRANQQELHDHRAELRGLIQRIVKMPVEMATYQKTYESEPQTLSQLSGTLNQENTLLANQAAEIIEKIPSTEVGSAEFYSVALALSQAGLENRALNLAEKGTRHITEPNSAVDLFRLYAGILFPRGEYSKAREQYRKALDVFEEFNETNTYIVANSHFLTETAWSRAEAGMKNCSDAREHLNKSEEHLAKLWPGPITDRFKSHFAEVRKYFEGQCGS